jgi:hypothetical protein
MSEDRYRLLVFALAAGGLTTCVLQIAALLASGILPFPGGDAYIWDRVGDQLRDGITPYGFRANPSDSFIYAPPWAVAFAATSWLPVSVQAAILVVAKIASLRIIGGSWTGAAIACWFPLVAFDLVGGNFNLLVAAAIVAAVRGRPELAVATALAKLSPILAIHPSDWRRAAMTLAVAVIVTIPWLGLWIDWGAHLLEATGVSLGVQIPVPLWMRAALAVLLLIGRRPWMRALAAAIALPAFYWGSLVVLLAPLAVFIRGPRRTGYVELQTAGSTP